MIWTIIQLVISGIAMGFVYALIGIEYTLIYNASGVLNFSHDKMVSLGAYIYAGMFVLGLGWNSVVSAIASLLLMAVATSIDALAMGITFAFLSVSIGKASGLIGCTTFVISALGVFIGNRFGAKYKDKASLTGGIILILIGCKVLLEHLGILG